MTGNVLTLNNNASDTTTLSANGNFSFSTPVAYNGSYIVTVATQPTGQLCSVNGASGAGVIANVDNVICRNNDVIRGTVSGLSLGEQVTLQNNLGNDNTLDFNGPFTFGPEAVDSAGYDVTVSVQPSGKVCTVYNGKGTGVAAYLSVTCSNIP